jgi:hypothetical protein
VSLTSTLLSVLLSQTSPGGTQYSVEIARDCSAAAKTCPDARWSTFYGTWVRRESKATAEARFGEIARAAVEAADEVLCLDDQERPRANCTPYPGAIGKRGLRWSRLELATMTTAVAIIESGLREDVQVGRGSARKASDDGGRGRGPGREACLLQIHPVIYQRFTQAPLKELLGRNQQNLRECFATGMRMLINARAYCTGQAPRVPWDWATSAMYVSGSSCSDSNSGKTAARTHLFRRMLTAMQQRTRASKS